MSLKKFLTGKPGNIPELIETASTLGQPVEITHKVIKGESQMGTVTSEGMTTYRVGEYTINKVYTLIKDPIIDNLKKKAKKYLDLIKTSGLEYKEMASDLRT